MEVDQQPFVTVGAFHYDSERRAMLFCLGNAEMDEVKSFLAVFQAPIHDFSLKICPSFFMVEAPSSRIAPLLKYIGAMPNLKVLHIGSLETEELNNEKNSVEVSALSGALNPNLKQFTLENLWLRGSLSDMDAFAHRMQTTLLDLESFVLDKVGAGTAKAPPRSTGTGTGILDTISTAMVQMPSLRGACLEVRDKSLGVLLPSSLQLCFDKGNKWEQLTLGNVGLSTPHLRVLGAANRHKHLRRLDLNCHITVEGALAITRMLRTQRTLMKLTLRLTSDGGRSSAIGLPHGRNKASSEVQLHRNQVLAQGIVASPVLAALELFNVDLSTKELREPFSQMLQDNYSLRVARFRCEKQGIEPHDLRDQSDFYTRLNKYGRSHLFRCPRCSVCDDAYIAFMGGLPNRDKDHLSTLFYFLRNKPSLFLNVQSDGESLDAGQRATGKRKRLHRFSKHRCKSYKV
ncbi:expressed unknown protein [Seminavis robusta]|uniref:Uncharacterized protein n=1 Tax=Seminavis robusta TaxID=568900 RepID=A0A9N8EPJ3_9STRA|nr:expressed unknown protein [Seminavis robusta]|eukprot:Sro1702_g292250.1 n/a (459) ;mRNA; r:16571-17947